MTSTTIKVESETLELFRNNRIQYQAKHKISKLNDDGFVRYLLGQKTQWHKQNQNKLIWTTLSENQQSSPYTPPTSQASPLPPGQEIPNYLWQSIVVTIFCCWPFGIPAIVYAAKVDSLKARGDISGAMAASASAKTWCMVSVGVIVALICLWMIGAIITGLTQ